MKTINQKEKFFNKLSEDLEFDIMDYCDLTELEDINNFEELEGKLLDQDAFNVEIIYYSKAMDYLRENDSSLSESMEIAYEYGYETKNINSELLAGLLASQNAREGFGELEETIEEFLN